MRLQVGRRIASAMLAFILLVVGMCVESLRPADFYLVCNPSERTNAVVSNPGYQLTLERMYIPQLMRTGSAIYLNANHRRTTSSKESKILMTYIAAERILAQLCMRDIVRENCYCVVVTSHTSIVSYIQLQDGKK